MTRLTGVGEQHAGFSPRSRPVCQESETLSRNRPTAGLPPVRNGGGFAPARKSIRTSVSATIIARPFTAPPSRAATGSPPARKASPGAGAPSSSAARSSHRRQGMPQSPHRSPPKTPSPPLRAASSSNRARCSAFNSTVVLTLSSCIHVHDLRRTIRNNPVERSASFATPPVMPAAATTARRSPRPEHKPIPRLVRALPTADRTACDGIFAFSSNVPNTSVPRRAVADRAVPGTTGIPARYSTISRRTQIPHNFITIN